MIAGRISATGPGIRFCSCLIARLGRGRAGLRALCVGVGLRSGRVSALNCTRAGLPDIATSSGRSTAGWNLSVGREE